MRTDDGDDYKYSQEWRDEMRQDEGLTHWWDKEAETRPWIATDPENPCKEWRETGKHCSRCPYDPCCNE